MGRRVTEHSGRTFDNEKLMIITIFEEGAGKKEAKEESACSKRHDVLIRRGYAYGWKDE
ncbi:hypothetical protein LRR81_08775 [Metabacillus sp. GX 13764]|uniref:hypothetical protein n=1 Tax=Metabacillus kandeliae TaxID=2900151 RepID=UPI001E3D6168|nr:hypothetical protein [Metabacillus kandeliae]MCD7034327.1 hypothetical protein [Metabacillus kandeliae]